jgi:Xaa-Pro aminopeptidase
MGGESMESRVAKLLAQGGNDGAYVLHKPENVRYFSGFLGEGMLVIGDGLRVIVTDFRYEEQAQIESPGWEILLTSGTMTHARCIAEAAARTCGKARFEYDFISVKEAEALKAALEDTPMVDLCSLPEEIRMIKDESEIEATIKAAALTDETFAWILDNAKVGMSEEELALDLFVFMKRRGADGTAFSSIVASGPNASLPHAVPTSRKFQPGDLLTLDFGAKWDGYCADFTRTIAFGKVEPELRKIYDIVLEAQLRSLDALCSGKKGKDVDAVARGIIENAGYGKHFGHGLGHSVGLMIHEEPRLSVRGERELAPGMLMTVEPGIYLPGRGGVRIEDLCLITEGGCEVLSSSTKEFIEL